MAKWGEGDPRWIVEERADATNVNNWHWTERNVTSWSEERLKALLQEVRVEGSEGVCQVTDVSKLEGEACINNRKGKLFYFFEWVIRANWTGTSKTGVKYRGTVDVANLSDENDADDLDISVALCADHPPTPLVQLMKTKGIPEVRRALDQYMKQLKTEFSQGMILPSANGPKSAPAPVQTPSPGAPCSVGKASTTNIQLKETFSTTPDELYATFISQDFVQIFTRSPAQVDAQSGGQFQLLDGAVSGKFVHLVNNIHRAGVNHFATVILLFEDGGGETHLYVDIQGVPSGSEDSTREGWNRFYLQAIKQTFGY
uniref:Activator of HSP90 ATPase activity 1 n=1 Tax=Neogobius melanostomus TaxID=47308 RepID=A0A8C6S7C4_9GOBI